MISAVLWPDALKRALSEVGLMRMRMGALVLGVVAASVVTSVGKWRVVDLPAVLMISMEDLSSTSAIWCMGTRWKKVPLSPAGLRPAALNWSATYFAARS